MARRLGLVLVATCVASVALGSGTGASVGTVTVAVKPVEPFVYLATDRPPVGYSIDLWNEVALELGLETTWVEFETVGDIIDSLALEEVDVGIAAISMPASGSRSSTSHTRTSTAACG